MRLALIVPGFSAAEDDWCIPALLDLVRALARRHDVTVFALRYPHHRRSYAVAGARVVPFGAATRRGPGRLLMALRAWRSIRAAARRERFDVVHALWAHEPGALAVALGRRLDTPTVVSVLGGELIDLPAIDYGGGRGWLNRRLVRQALLRADRVTVPTPALASEALPLVGPERLVELPLGVDTQRFHPDLPAGDGAIRLDGAPVLLQVGSLVPVKDHETLLRAFATLADDLPKARLHLVGEGPLETSLRGLARSLGAEQRVRFHGAVDHGQLPDLYRQADLVTISSRFESQCMALLEAAACGRPLAGTTVGLLPSLVPSPMTAPPGRPGRMAAAMRRALDQPIGTSEAEARARGHDIACQWGLDVTTERLDRLYRSVRRTS